MTFTIGAAVFLWVAGLPAGRTSGDPGVGADCSRKTV